MEFGVCDDGSSGRFRNQTTVVRDNGSGIPLPLPSDDPFLCR
jgi:hypothetical protein